MIDFHNHVLPNLDDGSKTMDQTIAMLNTAVDQGITDVICTVHYQHPKMEGYEVSHDIVNETIQQVENKFNNPDFKLHLGAEVFYLPNLLEIKSDPLTVFNHGKYMLVEFQTFQLPPQFDTTLYNLVMSGTTPIIAHAERYKPIQENLRIVEKLIHSGCLIQLNAGSILGKFGQQCKKTAELMLKRNMVHFIGSDAHNDTRRNFCLKPAIESARKIIGDQVDILVNENPLKLIQGEKIRPFEILEMKRKKLLFGWRRG